VESVFPEFFRHMLRLYIEKEMVSGRLQAVDSAFVKTNASLSSHKELSSAEENSGEENTHREKVRRDRPGKTGMNDTCRSTTDPDAPVYRKNGEKWLS
jgi:hypothetical protein